MSDGIVITTARIFWTVCGKCGRAYPDAIKTDAEGHDVPGTEVGHRACPQRSLNLGPGGR